MINSYLMLYIKLVGGLIRAGFRINMYDPCMMKTILGGDHIMVLFHMDDLKVSHKIDKAITKVIEYVDGIYQGLKALRGDVHDYLGMRLD